MQSSILSCLLLCSTVWAQSVPLPAGPLCEACAENDLMFIIDASASINDTNYQAEITFIENILDPNKQSQPSWGKQIGYQVKVSAIVFKASVVQFFTFDQSNSYNEVYSYLEDFRKINTSGSSNLCVAEQRALNLFQQKGRPNVPKTLMILTDGDPNGACTGATAIQIAGTMKNTPSLSVEILCIAVAGSNGYQPTSNLPFLQQIASTGPVNGQQQPMVWSLTDGNALQQAEQSITSRMSCCSCYPDLTQTMEIDDYTQGSDSAFLQNMFMNANAVANYWFQLNSQYSIVNAAQALSILSNQNKSQVVISSCTDMNCWNNAIYSGCPEVTSGYPAGTLNCSWFSGNSDISAALQALNVLIQLGHFGSPSAPNFNIIQMTGSCTSGAGCSNGALNSAINEYQTVYFGKIGSVLYPGSGAATNTTMVFQVVGDTGTVVDGTGKSGVPSDNSNCLKYSIARILSDVPGCAAQPYVESGLQNTCQYT